nr:50S ribosomal protein L9 [Desulfuromonadales bacterium]
MKVILTQDVSELGKKGDVVDVADGYARNYLVPKSMAVKASAGAMRQAETMREARAESERRAREEADRIKGALEGTKVVIAAKAGDEGKLYGSIGPADVAEALQKFAGVEVDRKTIEINEAIRSIGLHQVTIRNHPDVEFTVSLDVVPG